MLSDLSRGIHPHGREPALGIAAVLAPVDRQRRIFARAGVLSPF